jgi:trehalose 6-phosphate phosphatase
VKVVELLEAGAGMKTVDQLAYGPFLDRLASAPDRVLLLDYDGTLAPFQIDRNLAVPYPEIRLLLARIRAAGTQVILISGRAPYDLAVLSGIDPRPEIWGSHGFERLKPDGCYESEALSRQQRAGLAMAAKLLQSEGMESRAEVKPGGVAIHVRGLSRSDAEDIIGRVRRLWSPLLAEFGLTLLEFDGGLEIRVPGRDKGFAVRTILAESFPDAAVAYLGDDRTDEDAFRALNGKGLTVLVRPEYRPTAAEVWLQPPQELIQFLEEWLCASGGKL